MYVLRANETDQLWSIIVNLVVKPLYVVDVKVTHTNFILTLTVQVKSMLLQNVRQYE